MEDTKSKQQKQTTTAAAVAEAVALPKKSMAKMMLVSMSFEALKEIVKWSSQTRAIEIALKSICYCYYGYVYAHRTHSHTHAHSFALNTDNSSKSPYLDDS